MNELSNIYQLNHYETLMRMPKIDIENVLYLYNISHENLGLIMRSADIFGISKVYYHHSNHNVNTKQLDKISRNSNVPIIYTNDEDILLSLKKSGYMIIALEITNASMPLRDIEFSSKTCLVVGNERYGIPDEILNTADNTGHIDMIGGHISSLNVSIATSIALYEISQYYIAKQSRYNLISAGN